MTERTAPLIGAARGRSPLQAAVHRLLANQVARGGLCIITAFVLIAALSPVFFPYNPAIDSDLLGLYAGLSQNSTPEGGIDAAALRAAILVLDAANAPLDNRALVISPTQKNVMLGVDEFVSMTYLGNQPDNVPTRTGLLGEIYGVPVFVSSNVISSGTSPSVVEHNLLFQKGAFALAIQLGPRVQANYIPQYLGTLVTVDVIYGVAELRDPFAVDLQTGA